jgi:uncharacterized protein YggE
MAGVYMKSNKVWVLGAVLAIPGIAASSPAQQIEVNKTNRTIAVTATDKATAAAEVATVHIGFQVYAADSQAAYALGSKTSNAIITALKKTGVEDAAIQSEVQNMAPVQQYEIQNLPENQKAQRQFQVTQSWSVKTSAKNAASVLDTAVQAGANQSGQIDWDVADPDALEGQAAESALKRAHAIADQMAKGLGATLGQLVYASNQVAERPVPLNIGGPMLMKSSAGPPAPLALSPQKVTRSATVYAVFAIE